MSLEIQISSSLLLTSVEQMTNFFSVFLQIECFLDFFFSEIMLGSFGCGLYTSLYGSLAVVLWEFYSKDQLEIVSSLNIILIDMSS